MVETTRRQAIEDAASSLFHEHGYSGTSVRDIARAVDIQGASLYAHVASKQEVLWSIVERTASPVRGRRRRRRGGRPGLARVRPGRPPDLARPGPRRGRHRRHRAGQRLRPRVAVARSRPARRHRAPSRRLRGPLPRRRSANGVEAGAFVAGRSGRDRRVHPVRAQRARRLVPTRRAARPRDDRRHLRRPVAARRPGATGARP